MNVWQRRAFRGFSFFVFLIVLQGKSHSPTSRFPIINSWLPPGRSSCDCSFVGFHGEVLGKRLCKQPLSEPINPPLAFHLHRIEYTPVHYSRTLCSCAGNMYVGLKTCRSVYIRCTCMDVATFLSNDFWSLVSLPFTGFLYIQPIKGLLFESSRMAMKVTSMTQSLNFSSSVKTIGSKHASVDYLDDSH